MAEKKYTWGTRFEVIFFSILGIALVVFGMTGPAIKVSALVGTVDYAYQEIADWEQYVFFAAMGLMLWTSFSGQYLWLRIFYLLTILAPSYPWWSSFLHEETMWQKIGGGLASPVIDLGWSMIAIGWGFYVMIGGKFCLLIAAVKTFSKKKKTGILNT